MHQSFKTQSSLKHFLAHKPNTFYELQPEHLSLNYQDKILTSKPSLITPLRTPNSLHISIQIQNIFELCMEINFNESEYH